MRYKNKNPIFLCYPDYKICCVTRGFSRTLRERNNSQLYLSLAQKSIKKYQQSLREVQARLEEEARAKEAAHDLLINNDRRAHANQVIIAQTRHDLELKTILYSVYCTPDSLTVYSVHTVKLQTHTSKGKKREVAFWK